MFQPGNYGFNELVTSSLASAFLAAALATAAAPASASPPAASATPSPAACAFSAPAYDAVPFEDALSHPVTDDAVLRFIDVVAAAPPQRQSEILDRAGNGPIDKEVASAIATSCLGTEVTLRLARAVILIANTWQQGNVDRAMDGGFFTGPLASAVGALTLRERLAGAVATRALEPFGPRSDLLAPAPAALSAGCSPANLDAKALAGRTPEYPAVARSMRVSALVQVKVTLSAGAYVESVSIYQYGASAQASEVMKREFEEASLLAALQTTYEAARADCKPVSGAYLLRFNFTVK